MKNVVLFVFTSKYFSALRVELIMVMLRVMGKIRPLGYERVYLPLCKVADTPFQVQGDEYVNRRWWPFRSPYIFY